MNPKKRATSLRGHPQPLARRFALAPRAEDAVDRMRHLEHGRLGAEPAKILRHRLGLGDERVHRAQRVARQRQVAWAPFVGNHVVQEKAGADSPPTRAARDGPVGGSEERHPILEDDEVGADLSDASRRPKPTPRADAVDEALGVDADRLRAGLVLRLAGEEHGGILAREGDHLDLVAAGDQLPGKERDVVRDPAPVRIRGSDQHESHAALPSGRSLTKDSSSRPVRRPRST